MVETEGLKQGVLPIALATDILATVVSGDLVGAGLDVIGGSRFVQLGLRGSYPDLFGATGFPGRLVRDIRPGS